MEVSLRPQTCRKKLEDGSLNLQKKGTIAGKNMQYVLVVDDSFPLREYIMKPFNRKVATPTRKIFNHRVFGIIVERFSVLQKHISLIDLTKVHYIVMACCALHNSLHSKLTPFECLDEEEFESGNVMPGPHCNESMSRSKTACHPTNSAELLAGRPAELREFPQANSPDDLPAGRHIHASFAFQARTVQANRKAELYVYDGPKHYLHFNFGVPKTILIRHEKYRPESGW
ncbi:hypothetical protein PR048_021062 [Dryococelus australis]|uniref:DDE Tnp4 domain-containing protein n=1 Tax=Dryococelus australis TaxID=614101 RepID=A0ABQ9GX62_9NEOP|nr:hypothetical protein PR048_021062 [Dryococelus australis]